ncbi:MAG: hypothetical protein HYU41_12955 [Candidatus Rokubacteria bacterium]|nr:hypothetical protein [Candidatus Rokubacteria bacterium]
MTGAGVVAPDVVEAAAAAPLTLVVGEVNLGKTTLVTRVANALLARGLRVGVIDADVGQSEVGPPTTVGLGRVVRPLERLGDAEPVALRFVGATSPVRDQAGTIAAVARLAVRARAEGLTHVLVDTSGLVRGDLGLRLKQAKIDALAPDLLLVLDRGGECDPILAPYLRAGRPRVVRVPVPDETRARSPEERRRHRDRALAAHFDGARRVTLDLRRVVLRRPALFVGEPIESEELLDVAAEGTELLWGERRGGEIAVVSRARLGESERRGLSRRLGAQGFVEHALEDIVGMLAGLEDAELDMLALARVSAIDFEERTLAVETTADVDRVVSVNIGREPVARRGE